MSLLLPLLLCGQELVHNGGFENHRKCPTRFDKKPFTQLVDVRPINGVPGYFHACSEVMGTPANWAGIQAPFEGEGYVGLVLTAHGGGECNTREFIQLPLERPLANGGKYHLSLRVSLADRSGYMTDRIGACFTTDDRSGKKGLGDHIGRADIDNAMNRFISDTSAWMLVEGIYNARGGERYIQIGNFQLCDRTSRKAVTPNRGKGVMDNMKKRGNAELDPDRARGLRRRMLATQAYVYVDAVSLMDLHGAAAIPVLIADSACAKDPGSPATTDDLVPDPAFDNNVPTHRSIWKNASGGTPDLFDGHTGIYLYSAVNKDHREYIQSPLKERLDPCGIYTVRMRIQRDRSYGYVVDRIGAALAGPFENDRRRDLLPFDPVWELHGQGVLDPDGWTTLCGTFPAQQCASTLLIGNFASDDSTTIVQRDPNGGPFAYYFVDDISLWRSGTTEGCTLDCPEEVLVQAIAEDSVPVAPRWPLNLYFEVNDHVPSDELLVVTEELLHVMTQLPGTRVVIEGHTDASGNEHANEVLSKRRALSVHSALNSLGVPADRMTVKALGSKEPIATNETQEGRALNRRVQIVLLKAGY